MDRPIFTTGSTYHPSLASSPTTRVPLPLTAVAYLCGPAVHFVLCFILQPEGAFDCPRCPGWCLSLCDAAAVACNACTATCCCCAIYRCLLLLPAVLSLLLFGERGELAVNYFGNKLLLPPSTVWGWGLQGWWCLWGRGGSKLLR